MAQYIEEATAMMQRMRELAVQAASGTMSSTDRTATFNTEYQALNDQILEIAGNTQWNGTNILDDTVGTTGSVDFHVGANASSNHYWITDFGSCSRLHWLELLLQRSQRVVGQLQLL